MYFKQKKLPEKNYVVVKSNRSKLMKKILSGVDNYWFPMYGPPILVRKD